MQDLLGRKIEPRLCAIRQIKNRQDQVGFFKETRQGNLNFVRVDTKISFQTDETELVQVKTRVHNHEKFYVFSYETEIINHLFSESSEFFGHLPEETRNAAKQFFIELASSNQVSGAPEADQLVQEEVPEEMPDYLELDGLEEDPLHENKKENLNES